MIYQDRFGEDAKYVTLSRSAAAANTSCTAGEGDSQRRGDRIVPIDFTKGALVLIMVLYHWMNYFLNVDPSVYRYLRFLTPSFIFITGFLISQIYLSRDLAGGFLVPRRLQWRGLKLLILVLLLNLAMGATNLKSVNRSLEDVPSVKTAMAYILGTRPIAFSVLVPIAYLLMLSAGLLIVSRFHKYIFYEACVAALACSLISEVAGIQSGYLDLVGIGLLGVIVGYIPIAAISGFVEHPAIVFVAYVLYLAAIARWNVVYTLQIIGVCVNLAVLYWLGVTSGGSAVFGRTLVRLGRYSLFAYIAQIVVLNMLQKIFRSVGSGMTVPLVTFLAALLCTIMAVNLVDRSRARIPVFNKWYTAVFS